MKPRREHLQIDPKKCTACHQCTSACAMAHEGVDDPAYARIQILQFENQGLNLPVVCMACEKPVCINVCPMNARMKAPNGTVVTDTRVCIGCKACQYICPNGSPAVHPVTGRTMTCDMCGDDPKGPRCVEACREYGALTLCEPDIQRTRMARQVVGRMRRVLA